MVGRGRKVTSQMELEDGYFNENCRDSCSYVCWFVTPLKDLGELRAGGTDVPSNLCQFLEEF